MSFMEKQNKYNINYHVAQRKHMQNKIPDLIIETFDKQIANQLYWSGEWRSPEWDDKKGYILIRKSSEVKKLREKEGKEKRE